MVDGGGFEEAGRVYAGDFGEGAGAVGVPLHAGGGLQGGRLVEGVSVRGVGCADPRGFDVVVVFEAAAYCREVEPDGDGVFF